MSRVREEPWGQIEYDPKSDAFVTHTSDGESVISVGRPLSAGCLLTGRCNLRCTFCYGNDEALPNQELSEAEWRHAFSRLKSWGLMRVDLSGGEPTLRKDLPEIAQGAVDAGLNVILSTNGIPLHQTGPKQLPLSTRIHVSLDSGFASVHKNSRLLRSLLPSSDSFEKTGAFIRKSLDQGYRVRIMTCVGRHNCEGLFQLGEYIATSGVAEWNISRVLKAGRAQADYERRWQVDDAALLDQIHNMREAYPWIRIRYSNRTQQEGYFLLVLPDGTLATQWTDGRDKVILGKLLEMSLDDLRKHPDFNLDTHSRKWLVGIS